MSALGDIGPIFAEKPESRRSYLDTGHEMTSLMTSQIGG